MRSIAQAIGDYEKDRNLRIVDALGKPVPIMQGGFTAVPNYLLDDGSCPPGAQLVYIHLLRYAWQNDFCYPGQESLAKKIGVTRKTINTWTKQAVTAGILVIRRRGQGRSNMYDLLVTRKKRPARKVHPVG